MVAEALDRSSRDQEDVARSTKRLRFAGVGLVTLDEGEITDPHVGLKGTMNALFLKDLADKTRHGLRGCVEAGLSGGGRAYGYGIVRERGPDGLPSRGLRRINPRARALLHGASAVIMIHTRPSDDPTPSEADVHLSRQVTAALATLGIAMHDHAIVGKNRVVSLRSQRLI